MRALTETHFRALAVLLMAGIALIWLLPFIGIEITVNDLSLDEEWVHFLVYALAATLCLLAWRSPRPLVIAWSLFALSVVLQILHNYKLGRHIDVSTICVNLLGIAAGVLLGFNLRTLRSQLKQQISLNPYQPNDQTSSE